jgi:tRNA pseudouridine-54 N-methylase
VVSPQQQQAGKLQTTLADPRPPPPTLKICAKFKKGMVEAMLDTMKCSGAKGSPCVTMLDGTVVSLTAFVEKANASLVQHGEKVTKVGGWKADIFVMTDGTGRMEKLSKRLQQHGLQT